VRIVTLKDESQSSLRDDTDGRHERCLTSRIFCRQGII
jgi:hypothetical protein